MAAGEPDLTVVIPTLNNRTRLAFTMDSLKRQRQSSMTFELIVVDNSCTDGTSEMLQEVALDFPIPLTVLHESRPGAASAKNAGAGMARGGILLFLGDDTEPSTPDLFERHVEFHRTTAETQMLVGKIEWTPRQEVTPFMGWLDTGGPQFHFNDLKAGEVDPSFYFYGSHSSLKRAMFESIGGFDSRFSGVYEDIELGSRLARAGAQLEYDPDLIVWHDHPTDLRQSLARMDRVGQSAALVNDLLPDFRHPAVQAPRGLRWAALSLVSPFLRLGRGSKTLWARHMAAYARGYRREVAKQKSGSEFFADRFAGLGRIEDHQVTGTTEDLADQP